MNVSHVLKGPIRCAVTTDRAFSSRQPLSVKLAWFLDVGMILVPYLPSYG